MFFSNGNLLSYIQCIHSHIYRLFECTEYPTSSEYTDVCKSLISKYPVLKDTIGNGYVSQVIHYILVREGMEGLVF